MTMNTTTAPITPDVAEKLDYIRDVLLRSIARRKYDSSMEYDDGTYQAFLDEWRADAEDEDHLDEMWDERCYHLDTKASSFHLDMDDDIDVIRAIRTHGDLYGLDFGVDDMERGEQCEVYIAVPDWGPEGEALMEQARVAASAMEDAFWAAYEAHEWADSDGEAQALGQQAAEAAYRRFFNVNGNQ